MSVGFFLVPWQLGFSLALPAFLLFFAALVVLALIDWDVQLLPDVITLPGTVLGLATSFLPGSLVTWRTSLLTAVFAYLGFWAIAWLYEKTRGVEGLGQGDWKLVAMIGAFLGVERLLLTILLASFSGIVYALVHHALTRPVTPDMPVTPDTDTADIAEETVPDSSLGKVRLPFGTFLAGAAGIALLAGDTILGAYSALWRT